jgi:fibronectin type 3 domain-containing protein
VFGYYVYRATDFYGLPTLLNSTPLTVSQFTDYAVVPGQTYIYWITSVSSTTLQSSFSSPVAVTIPLP